LGITSVADVVRRGRLRCMVWACWAYAWWWLGVCISTDECWGREYSRSRGRARKTYVWQKCVNEDLKNVGLMGEAAQDRAGWRRGIFWVTFWPVHASTDISYSLLQADVKWWW
jgi:hypothetical protein